MWRSCCKHTRNNEFNHIFYDMVDLDIHRGAMDFLDELAETVFCMGRRIKSGVL